MKKCKLLTALLLFGLMVMSITGIVHAAPKVAKKTPVNGGAWYDSAEKSVKFSFTVSIPVKGASKKAKVSKITCSDKRFLESTRAYYDKQAKCWTVNSQAEFELKDDTSTGSFKISFDVKDKGKTTRLTTTCVFGTRKPFKSFKLGGVELLKAKKRGGSYLELPLAGKKASYSYKLNKGYKFIGIYKESGKQPVELKKTAKLKKGDVIRVEYYKKGLYSSDNAFIILVK